MKKVPTVIITGASSGLGKALFEGLTTTSADIICLSRRFLPGQRSAENTIGKRPACLRCDLSKTRDVLAAAKKLKKLLRGRRDVIFINNAATIEPIGLMGEVKDSDILRAVHTNVAGPFILMNMLREPGLIRRLTLIHIGTGASVTPIPGWALYCSTKAAVRMFNRVLQKEERGTSLLVYEIDPGIMDTGMQQKIRSSSRAQFPRVEEFKKYKKAGRLIDPHEIAHAIIQKYIRV